jgi:hypothetical protein
VPSRSPAVARVNLPQYFNSMPENGFELVAKIPKVNSMVIQIIVFELWPFQYHGCFGIEPNSISTPLVNKITIYFNKFIMHHVTPWDAGTLLNSRNGSACFVGFLLLL